jgi:uncharacterized protein YabN with tetrapyrrole methylase and pyrophosphatase domain
MEDAAKQSGMKLSDMTLQQMDDMWNEIKKKKH